MPTLSVNTDMESASEDQTLLTLCALAGEDFITFRPHFIHEIGRSFFSSGPVSGKVTLIWDVVVRELSVAEMERAEREFWIYYHQQKADRERDRLFAVFTGMKIIGVTAAPVMI